MQIISATTISELQKVDLFFEKLWKEEFNLDASNQVEYYKKSDIYYISENNEIISVIIYSKYKDKNYIWRFWTLKAYRWKWYWTALLNNLLKNYSWDFHLSSDEKQVDYYKWFGFKEISKPYKYWDTYSVDMVMK